MFAILCFSTLNTESSQAANVFYCGKFENYKCVKPHDNIGELWDNTTWSEFYNSNGFETEDFYFKFHTPHFEYYVPYYVIEREFETEDLDGYFTMNEWMDYDKNKNFIYT